MDSNKSWLLRKAVWHLLFILGQKDQQNPCVDFDIQYSIRTQKWHVCFSSDLPFLGLHAVMIRLLEYQLN